MSVATNKKNTSYHKRITSQLMQPILGSTNWLINKLKCVSDTTADMY